MKRFILTIFSMTALAALFVAQTQQGKLASLIQAGDRKAAFDMIRAGADVNEAQPDGTRPIHWAVYRVDYELMEALIAKKARANVTNELGSTPLAEAVKLSDPRMVKMLLDAGSGPEGANADGQTALMLAIKNGDLPIVQMLVNAGANVNVVEKVQDQTPLMWAAAANRNAAEMVKLLLSKGANVKVRAKYVDWPSQITSEPRAQYHSYGGLTPLLYAARAGCYGCVEALVSAGAEVNVPSAPEGVTPLMIALDYGHNNVAKFLMDHGANPHVWDVYGRTALYIAVDKKDSGAGAGGGRGGFGAGGGGRGAGAPASGAGARGAAGAAGQAAAGPGGRGAGRGGAGRGQAAPGGGGGASDVPAIGATGGPAVSSMEIINALLAAGVNPNAQLSARRPEAGPGGRFSDPLLSTGVTPLFRATMNNDMEVIRALLDRGASPNIYDMGLTPFLLAAGVEAAGGGGGRGGAAAPAAANTAVLDLFVQHGADINSQVTGRLSYSFRLSRNAGWPNIEGFTALHAAVLTNRADMVRYLLDHGARTDLRDASGRTVLDIANGVASKPAPANYGTANIPAPAGTTADDTTVALAGSNSAGAGRGAAPRPVSPEIKTMLEEAAQKK